MKKIIVVVSLLLIYIFSISLSKPILLRYSDRVEICLGKNGSASELAFYQGELFCDKIYGETITLDNKIPYQQIFSEFNASLVLVEETNYGTSYYGYSDKIKYCTVIDGKRVNLQVFEGKETKIGSPIIFGGY